MPEQINTAPVSVIKDTGGLHNPSPITRQLSCDTVMMNEEWITTIEQPGPCSGMILAGSIVTPNYPNSVRTMKVMEPDGTILYIEYADWAGFRTACEACCIP